MKLINANLILILILLSALFIRVYGLNISPPSLYWDEMDVGYQAYSILKTGLDYFGNPPGLVVHSFADYRAPLLIYLTIPFVALFGLSILAVKLPSVILGVISIYLIFILTRQLFQDKKIAILAALFSAFSPWSIHYSRIGFEVSLMTVLILAGVICVLKAVKKPIWFYASAIFFSLTFFSYNTTRLFVPLIVLLLVVLFLPKKRINKHAIIALVIFGLSLTINLYSSFFLGGGQRFNEISVFTDPFASEKIDSLRKQSAVGHRQNSDLGQQTRFADYLFYNKLTSILDSMIENYLKSFSTDFLFVSGDPNLRHSPKQSGVLLRIEFISVILGLSFLFFSLKDNKKTEIQSKYQNKSAIFLLLWILLAPFSASITREGGNHATRLFFLFPVFSIVSALGVVFVMTFISKKLKYVFLLSFFTLWLFNLLFFLNHYFGAYRIDSAKAFQYGFSEAVSKALEHTKGRDYVIIDDREDSALMNYLFDTSYDPKTFQSQVNSLQFEIGQFKAKKINNLVFAEPGSRDWSNIFRHNLIQGNYVLIVSARQLEEESSIKVHEKLTRNQKLLEIIKNPLGNPAFYIIESSAR